MPSYQLHSLTSNLLWVCKPWGRSGKNDYDKMISRSDKWSEQLDHEQFFIKKCTKVQPVVEAGWSTTRLSASCVQCNKMYKADVHSQDKIVPESKDTPHTTAHNMRRGTLQDRALT